MKKRIGVAVLMLSVAVVLAMASGCKTADRLLYNQAVTYTNAVVERVITNTVTVTNTDYQILERTRTVYVTNESGVVAGAVVREPVATNLVSSIVTNYVPVIVRVPEVVAVTNLVDRPGVLAAIELLPKGVDTFVPGLGSLLGLALAGAYHMYQQARNKKVSAALVQGVETARAVLTTTPQGQAADDALVAWLKAHQREAGVLGAVSSLVEAQADNAAAKMAAAEIAARVARAGGG